MAIWAKLDEVIGAGLLTSIAAYALHLGHTEIAGVCAGGIISLLSTKVAKKEV